jgi:hypothetical protein
LRVRGEIEKRDKDREEKRVKGREEKRDDRDGHDGMMKRINVIIVIR